MIRPKKDRVKFTAEDLRTKSFVAILGTDYRKMLLSWKESPYGLYTPGGTAEMDILVDRAIEEKVI